MGTLSLGYSEKLIMRFGPRTMLIPGMVLVGVALLLFARTPVDGNYLTDLLPPMLLLGVGIGISFPSLMTLAMSGATPSDAGLASGVVNTSAQVGGAIGLAVLATLAAERTDSAARRRRLATTRRSTPASTSPTWSAPGWSASPSRSRSSCCAPNRCRTRRRWPRRRTAPANRRTRRARGLKTDERCVCHPYGGQRSARA